MQEQVLYQLIHSLVQPTEEEWKDFCSNLTEVTFKKNDILINPHQSHTPLLYLITSGIVRHFTNTLQDDELTTWFNTTGSLATDYAAFTTNADGLFTIQAITDGTAYTIDSNALHQLYNKSKTWERMGRLINQYYLINLIQRNNSIHKKTATERYEEFMTTSGYLLKDIPLKYIASYLGITLETLSRLRSNTY